MLHPKKSVPSEPQLTPICYLKETLFQHGWGRSAEIHPKLDVLRVCHVITIDQKKGPSKL
jgi:hypothetical protein